jgi:ketosteroid isomerase-like protein
MDRRLILERASEAVAAWNRGDADGVVEHAVDDVIWQDVALPMPVHGSRPARIAAT